MPGSLEDQGNFVINENFKWERWFQTAFKKNFGVSRAISEVLITNYIAPSSLFPFLPSSFPPSLKVQKQYGKKIQVLKSNLFPGTWYNSNSTIGVHAVTIS